jgi:hypothetical protein
MSLEKMRHANADQKGNNPSSRLLKNVPIFVHRSPDEAEFGFG